MATQVRGRVRRVGREEIRVRGAPPSADQQRRPRADGNAPRQWPAACESHDRLPVKGPEPRYPAGMTQDRPAVAGHDGLWWIRGSGVCRDWNGIRYKLGMSGKNVGAKNLSMNVAMIPPGGVAGA